GERPGNRRRQLVGDGGLLEDPADLGALRADRLPLVRPQARELIEPIVDRLSFRHDPLEGVCRHAKASWHVDAFDPPECPQVHALAANDRDLPLVDLLEAHHVAAHTLSPLRVVVGRFLPSACEYTARPWACRKPPAALYNERGRGGQRLLLLATPSLSSAAAHARSPSPLSV